MSSVLRAIIVAKRGAGNIHSRSPPRNSRGVTRENDGNDRRPSVRTERKKKKKRVYVYVCVCASVVYVCNQHEHCQSLWSESSRSILYPRHPPFIRDEDSCETVHEIEDVTCYAASFVARRPVVVDREKKRTRHRRRCRCVARERAQERARGPLLSLYLSHSYVESASTLNLKPSSLDSSRYRPVSRLPRHRGIPLSGARSLDKRHGDRVEETTRPNRSRLDL